MISEQISGRWTGLVAFVTLNLFVSPSDLIAQKQATTAEQQHVESRNHAKALSTAFRFAAQEALPSVVSIRTVPKSEPKVEPKDDSPRRPGVPRENPFEGTPFEDFFREFEFRQSPNTPFTPRRPGGGMGSGVIINASGVILTNNHVVEGAGEIRIRLNDKREFTAVKVQTDPRTDLAVVWIEGANDLKAVRLGDSDKIEIGDWVLAVGHPFGLFESVTAGIISAKGRGNVGVAMREEFLQTDAAINPGNSGGPLINLDGEVVGINTAISSRTGGYQGAGFAIPVNLAKWVSRQLVETGSVRRAYLGTVIRPVSQELSERFGVPIGSGALIWEVLSGSPGDKAGLVPGDVVVQFGNKKISGPNDLVAAVETAPIGSAQPAKIIRDGNRMTIEVTVEQQPADYGLARRGNVRPRAGEKEFGNFGIQVKPLTPEVAARLGLNNAEGVLVGAVQQGSPAEQAGLEAGMAITRINGNATNSVEDFEAVVEKVTAEEKQLVLLVRTTQGSRLIEISNEQ